jgi:hypothetical protein
VDSCDVAVLPESFDASRCVAWGRLVVSGLDCCAGTTGAIAKIKMENKRIPNFFTAMLILLDWFKCSILCANDLP